jgi:hypothetical protein
MTVHLVAEVFAVVPTWAELPWWWHLLVLELLKEHSHQVRNLRRLRRIRRNSQGDYSPREN